VTLTDRMEQARHTRGAIEELIANPSMLGPDFQPVRDLTDRAVVAVKATGRGRPGTVVGDTLSLLAGAQSLGLVERLDWAFRCHAFDVALQAGLSAELHLTPEPETFCSPCPPRLAAAFARGVRGLRVVAELHDDAFADTARLRSAVQEMAGWGWRLAVADLSGMVDGPAAPRPAAALEWLRPAYVQVDVAGPDSPARAGWLAAAASCGAQVMALGVDNPTALDTARSLGASCGRGRMFGEPGPLT
jgi:EAL domain-containing protein (putative c-di-GMP-specific phosphodiesterase class I)